MTDTKKYQTISEFMRMPFGRSGDMNKNTKYAHLYDEYIKNNNIRVEAVLIIEDSYYVHVKVPSESHKDSNFAYDVVIRFFTDNPDLLKDISLRSYYIQFFSNSPGFIYKYATLYKKEGFLIESLFNKLDHNFNDVMPEKSNPDMNLSYDKSIYFACKYLSQMKFRILNKTGILLHKKKSKEKFLSDISDFKSTKFDQELLSTERKLKNQLDIAKQHRPDKAKNDTHRVFASKSTNKSITGKKSIMTIIKKTGASGRMKKRSATKSTLR